jgi:hypothetical protein
MPIIRNRLCDEERRGEAGGCSAKAFGKHSLMLHPEASSFAMS